MPTVGQFPIGTASPCSASRKAIDFTRAPGPSATSPPSRTSTESSRCRSTRTPPSSSGAPSKLCPPERTETRSPISPAQARTAATSSGFAAAITAAGSRFRASGQKTRAPLLRDRRPRPPDPSGQPRLERRNRVGHGALNSLMPLIRRIASERLRWYVRRHGGGTTSRTATRPNSSRLLGGSRGPGERGGGDPQIVGANQPGQVGVKDASSYFEGPGAATIAVPSTPLIPSASSLSRPTRPTGTCSSRTRLATYLRPQMARRGPKVPVNVRSRDLDGSAPGSRSPCGFEPDSCSSALRVGAA